MNRKKYQDSIRNMVTAAVFASLILVLTAFVHIPTHQGYVHIGDGLIYLAAAVLPAPYAIAASAIGAGLSDYISGYAVYVLPTVIIKSLTAAIFSSKGNKILTRRNLIVLIPAALICVGGYYAAGAAIDILSGTPFEASLIAALADIPTNIIQSVLSSILFIILAAALDKLKFKKS